MNTQHVELMGRIREMAMVEIHTEGIGDELPANQAVFLLTAAKRAATLGHWITRMLSEGDYANALANSRILTELLGLQRRLQVTNEYDELEKYEAGDEYKRLQGILDLVEKASLSIKVAGIPEVMEQCRQVFDPAGDPKAFKKYQRAWPTNFNLDIAPYLADLTWQFGVEGVVLSHMEGNKFIHSGLINTYHPSMDSQTRTIKSELTIATAVQIIITSLVSLGLPSHADEVHRLVFDNLPISESTEERG